MHRPDASEYAPYFEKYVSLVPESDCLALLHSELEQSLAFFKQVPEAEETRLHLTYTWTFRQVVGHMLDAERVFGYRALRFARNDQTALHSFDENAYVQTANFDQYPLRELVEEFAHLRRSHILMFRHLTPDAWDRRGLVNQNTMSVRALAFILVGHERHHLAILRRRLASVTG